MPKKLRIAVLSGGNSPERKISLVTGQAVADNLDKSRYDIAQYDPATDLSRLIADRKNIDVAFVALHGEGGEDGTIQKFLEKYDIPYTFSGVKASALAIDKKRTKQHLCDMNIPIARDWLVKDAKIPKRIPFPVIVKPNSTGSSVAISICENTTQLNRSVKNAFKYDQKVLIEEYITGTEVTVATLGNDEPVALPVIEIVPNKSKFYDYAAKYDKGGSTHHCPARISGAMTKKVQKYAVVIHRALNLRGAARADFIIRDNIPYFLEVNTIPGMTPTSLLPEAARAAGIPFPKLLDRIIELALSN